jgi:hypothetical protein
MYLMEMCNKYGSDQGYVVFWGLLGKPILAPSCPRITAKLLKSNGQYLIFCLKTCAESK